MESTSQPFAYHEHIQKETEVTDLTSQHGSASQINSQSPMFTPNPFGPSNMTFNPNIMMHPPFPRAHSPFGYGFTFQDLSNSSNIPLESHAAKMSRAPAKSNKVVQNTSISHIVGGSKNWSKDEDIALTKAWLYISVDADVGNNQKIANMWNRIFHVWRENMGTYDESRTTNGLQARWGKIVAAVNKFHALYERLQRQPKSGASQEDMRREAMRMYEDINNGQSFKYEHCWEIMKTNSKWCVKKITRTKDNSKQKAINGSGDTQAPTQPGSSGNEGEKCTNVDGNVDGKCNDIERPEGRKATKEKKRRLNDEKFVVDVFNKLQTTMEKQICISQEELKMKREKDLKDFELREKIMEKELELKEHA
ncbi:unnamed protein product [Cuscuta europaea]|uniref:No apical meristem-associated C-terminal domain-containing protein n=1 Tax=Cuscuta europaea TaxID=41803 RepID=A0A9P1DYD8_CUSEU|nr:unnamed protein product [Cuscuta europaea]